MIQLSVLTRTPAAAERLAEALAMEGLLHFMTIEDHMELTWGPDGAGRTPLTHLHGIARAMHYTLLERKAHALLGDELVRMWSTPVTNMDPGSTAHMLGTPREQGS
jgi:hypothetical protein